MKINKYKLLILTIVLLLSLNVYAENLGYYLSNSNQNDYYQIKYFPDEQTGQNEEIQNSNRPSKFSNI